jgi:hypothetical protein
MKLRKYALKIDIYDHATIKRKGSQKREKFCSHIKFQFEKGTAFKMDKFFC